MITSGFRIAGMNTRLLASRELIRRIVPCYLIYATLGLVDACFLPRFFFCLAREGIGLDRRTIFEGIKTMTASISISAPLGSAATPTTARAG